MVQLCKYVQKRNHDSRDIDLFAITANRNEKVFSLHLKKKSVFIC